MVINQSGELISSVIFLVSSPANTRRARSAPPPRLHIQAAPRKETDAVRPNSFPLSVDLRSRIGARLTVLRNGSIINFLFYMLLKTLNSLPHWKRTIKIVKNYDATSAKVFISSTLVSS